MLKRQALFGAGRTLQGLVTLDPLTDIIGTLVGSVMIFEIGLAGLGKLVRMWHGLTVGILELGLCCFELISLGHRGLLLVEGPFHFKF